MTAVDQKIAAILGDPCVSYWLKDALITALKRDPLDAVHDAKVLAETLHEWLNSI